MYVDILRQEDSMEEMSVSFALSKSYVMLPIAD